MRRKRWPRSFHPNVQRPTRLRNAALPRSALSPTTNRSPATEPKITRPCPPEDMCHSLMMLPVEHNDPINSQILAISEDKIEGFVREPFEEIAKRSRVEVDVVMARIAAMLRAGTIRRVRQTLLATNLADGALIAWKVPDDKIESAFDWMFQRDPFSGHVVVRSTDTVTAGSEYKLWTTLK